MVGGNTKNRPHDRTVWTTTVLRTTLITTAELTPVATRRSIVVQSSSSSRKGVKKKQHNRKTIDLRAVVRVVVVQTGRACGRLSVCINHAPATPATPSSVRTTHLPFYPTTASRLHVNEQSTLHTEMSTPAADQSNQNPRIGRRDDWNAGVSANIYGFWHLSPASLHCTLIGS